MIEVEDITFSYGRGSRNVLENVSFEVEPNRCVAVLGTNGAGKSTLLKCMNRILEPSTGGVLLDGVNLHSMTRTEMARNVAFVPQRTRPLNMTVFDTVLLGRKPYITWDATKVDREIVARTMRRLDLESFALRYVTELSGGEAQKVMIARALAQEPKLLMLDEPTSNLDPKNQHEVLKLVTEIAREAGKTVMVVLHDLDLAARYCDRFLFLKDSELFAYGDRSVMTADNIGQVYDIPVEVADHRGVPMIIPYPDHLDA